MAKRVVVQFKMKTIKQYSAAGFFTILFLLIFIALPIVEIFFPMGAVSNTTIGAGELTSFNMIDITKSVLKMDNGNLLTLFSDASGGYYPGHNPQYYDIFQKALPIVFIVLMSLFFLQGLLAIIALILFIVFLIRGRWSHFKEPNVLSHFGFWSTFLISIGIQGLIIFSTTMNVGGYGNVKSGYLIFSFPGWLYSLCYLGAAMIGFLGIFVFYEYGFADRIYVGKNKRKNEPDVRELGTPNQEIMREETKPEEPEPIEQPQDVQEKVEEPETKKDEIIGTTVPLIVPQVEPEPQKGLPQDVPSIGGHAFAENQNVIIADIPTHVEKLGDAAFSNCLNLETIYLHRGIKSIGSNCFFNCARLKRINYEGTKKEWKNIKRGSNWLLKAGTKVVHCADGPIQVNPFH